MTFVVGDVAATVGRMLIADFQTQQFLYTQTRKYVASIEENQCSSVELSFKVP